MPHTLRAGTITRSEYHRTQPSASKYSAARRIVSRPLLPVVLAASTVGVTGSSLRHSTAGPGIPARCRSRPRPGGKLTEARGGKVDTLPPAEGVIGLRQVDEMALGPPFGRSESGARRPVVVGTARHAMA